MRTTLLLVCFTSGLMAQNADPGRPIFEATCARCHGADGMGGERGPNIVGRLASRTDEQLAALIRTGIPNTGMPPSTVSDGQMPNLVRFLRTIQPRAGRGPQPQREKVTLTTGVTLEGAMLGRGLEDMQLRTDDQRLHLLRKSGERYREVTSETPWPGYNGNPGGNRYTTLAQITPANVKHLGPKWVFSVPQANRLQGTPIVVDGVMYVTNSNECYAIDAGTGRQIWRYQSRRQRVPGDSGANRGAAWAGDRIFIVTGDAHLLAIHRGSGELLWDTEMADWHQNYFASSAPLTVGNLVIAGTGGGEHGSRGFLAAYDQTTGKEAWRFWTIPAPGEPNADTWGKDIAHGGAPTWFTGTYDPQLDTVYWPTGNPAAEYNGDNRKGDNLYSDSVVALDAKTGKLKWHFQFTPHDLWDYDSCETPVLIDANWEGRPRKLLLHGNRNGFFYVLDRTNGKFLLGKPFVRNLTWASGLDEKGRPIKLPNQEPTAAGTRICPSQDGASNWFSPSYNPGTGLFYLQTFEKCSVYTKTPTGEWEAGKTFLGGSQRTVNGDDGRTRILKAIDIQTGAVKWELPQPGPAESWGGVISTSTGLVFFAEEGGAFVAADAKTGKPLWSFHANTLWKASPLAYQFDGKEYLAIAAGGNIIAFSLLE